jgi:uncharacterized protein YndB with AHSA1/START domain
MKWMLIIGGVIVLIPLAILVAGLFAPKSHEARVTVRIAKPPTDVWATITEFARVPEWNTSVTKAERVADRDGKAVWREDYGGFTATVVSAVVEPPTRLVREILPEGPFHGSWTWEIALDAGGSRLTIIERGTVENPFFRGMMIFHDNTKTARDYAAALARRLGTEAVPVS